MQTVNVKYLAGTSFLGAESPEKVIERLDKWVSLMWNRSASPKFALSFENITHISARFIFVFVRYLLSEKCTYANSMCIECMYNDADDFDNQMEIELRNRYPDAFWLRDIISSSIFVTLEHGTLAYDAFQKYAKRKGDLIIIFTGVAVIASDAMAAFVGRLYENTELVARVGYAPEVSLSSGLRTLLPAVIENAKTYYKI